MNTTYAYLALGDSYTIGEGVPLYENFPYQCTQLLRKQGVFLHAPEIVARTGWTTSELADRIGVTVLEKHYDIVSLLIGVNNQYRGLSAAEYNKEFEVLLKKAISLAGSHPGRVVVLSIPDWGLTPFAASRDRTAITREIGQFNTINRSVTSTYGAHYVDITAGSPETEQHPEYLAADGLHPSGKAYERWAKLLSETILSALR